MAAAVNSARVAQLLRALADEFERDDESTKAEPRRADKLAKHPRKRPTRAPYRPPMPTDIDVAAVKRMARKAGIHLP